MTLVAKGEKKLSHQNAAFEHMFEEHLFLFEFNR